jgi:hypothetical protein
VGFPNVRQCERVEETSELDSRYKRAIEDARARACEAHVRNFEEAVGDGSKAVINRSIQETVRLATDGFELYANYYQITEAEIRLPKGGEWDKWRRTAEEAVLPGYKERISFGALSLDLIGLGHYGPCTWVCNVKQIAHRTTVFEQNCVIFMWPFNFKDAARLPCGHRAVWQARGKLAAAKLSSKIDRATTSDRWPSLLLTPGASGERDEFIEVHIYGPLSIYSLEQVALQSTTPVSKAELRALNSILGKQGVPLKVL